MDIKITSAECYRPQVISLLTTEHLPTVDLPETLTSFFVALSNQEVIGVAGLEVYAHDGLLRSVAVNGAFRKRGIAGSLVEQIENLAVTMGLHNLYLLTETAAGYFKYKGFEQIARTVTPGSIQQSAEFGSVCPQSATVMKKKLNQI